MKKFLAPFLSFVLLITLTLVASGVINTHHAFAQNTNPKTGDVLNKSTETLDSQKVDSQKDHDDSPGFWTRNLINPLMTGISYALLKFMSFLLGVAGVLLNTVLDLTVVKMGTDFNSGGIGTAINSAWVTVRDVANMSFIFILLYLSIQLILGIKSSSDVRNLVVKIIVAALLINFSLFATKVVIDASNVVALTFYEAISPGATNTSASWTSGLQTGLSNSLMGPLNLSSLMSLSKNGEITTGGILTIGLMGSLMLLIATFIFFVISILFIIRYVVLIFVLILSPLAIIADVVPGIKSYFNKWKDALIGQAFFPAIYFFLTWITIKLFRGFMAGLKGVNIDVGANLANKAAPDIINNASATASYSAGIGTVMVVFSVVIAFLIASLVISKQMASKSVQGVDGLVKWASGVAGSATLGVAGRFGRGTVGRLGQTIAENKQLQQKALEGSMLARLSLAASKKTGSASFDIRGGALGKQLGAGDAQKGGYAKDKKKKEDERKELIKNIKSTAGTKEEGEKDRTERITFEAETALKDKKEEVRAEAENSIAEVAAARTRYEAAERAAEGTPYGSPERIEFGRAKAALDQIRKDKKDQIDQAINERSLEEIHALEDAKENSDRAKRVLDELKKERGAMVEEAAQRRDKAIEASSKGWKGFRRLLPYHRRVLLWGKIKKEDEQASSIIRQANKEKPLKDKIFEDLKKAQKEEADAEAAGGTGTPPSTPPTAAAPGPTTP